MSRSHRLTISHSVMALACLSGAAGELAAQGPPPIPGDRELHAVTRAIQADTAIQALRPPAVAYVWFQATRDGHVLAHGLETSRVSLHRRAAALGNVMLEGWSPAGVLAPAKVFYAWIEVAAKP